MKKIANHIGRFIRALGFILASIPFFFLIIIIPLFIKGIRREMFSEKFTKLWYKLLFACFGIKFEVEGNPNPEGKFIIYANHISFLDIPAITLAFSSKRLKFLAKKEIFSMPIIGWGLRIQRHINISKIGSTRKSINIIKEGKADAICIFPEGTRQKVSGELKELMQFKEGITFLIENLGLPAYPVAIIGTQNILPISAIVPKSGKIKVIIGNKIEPSEIINSEIINERIRNYKERRIIVSNFLKTRLEQIIKKHQQPTEIFSGFS